MLEKLLLLFCFSLPFQFALNPLPGVDLAVARVFSLVIFFIWIAQKKFVLDFKTYTDKTSLLFFAFFLVAAVSVFLSPNVGWSLRKLAFLLSFAPLYFVICDMAKMDKKILVRLLAYLVSGAALLALIGIFQFFSQFVFGIDAVYSFWGNNLAPFFLGQTFSQAVLAYPSWLVNSGGVTYLRAFGTFPDPHMFSYYLGMLFPWAILLAVKSHKNKSFFWIASSLLLLADLLSFTRGGYVALFFGGLVVLPTVTKKTAGKIMLLMLTLLILFYFVPNNPVGGRFASSFDVAEGSNTARLSNWQQALNVIREHPLGTGIGAYSLAIDSTANYRTPIYAHNLYLDVMAELGIIGVILFIALLLSALLSFWRGTKTDSFWIAGLASLTIFCVHSLVETPLYSVHVLPLLIILLAISSYVDSGEKSILA